MRYFLRDGALFIRGAFTMLMPCMHDKAEDGTITHISTIIAAHLPQTNTKEDTDFILETLLRKNGYDTDALSLSVTVPIDRLCIFAYDGIMVFILACPGAAKEPPGPVTIIVCSREPLPEAGLRTLQLTAEEAMHNVFTSAGYSEAQSGRHTVLICCEEREESPNVHERLARAQTLVSETITYGIPETWTVSGTQFPRTPAFYIHSSIGGDRWSRWDPEGCPYYPCHPSCHDQRCDFCYCPLYPCGDESQGKWLERENHGRIWSCEGCTLVHAPAVADYLKTHPEASLEELKQIRKKGKNSE
ncbi:hypothetical protein L1S32_11265 [Methanogenium sp. S4BF]|uniref:cysteine-rich small domain-containing protein n=1 Tax=Methanogenium sp. S4BF TaxID=1789226 RepID=UPI002416E247|nr:cysteine-rich small domain-containing protein [Methanogenium sp. S4BF]WFN34404.1 hypothetical protein L1S32_11265 [Methanogenium sp. S4BF]